MVLIILMIVMILGIRMKLLTNVVVVALTRLGSGSGNRHPSVDFP